jgi:hypothetical protein
MLAHFSTFSSKDRRLPEAASLTELKTMASEGLPMKDSLLIVNHFYGGDKFNYHIL